MTEKEKMLMGLNYKANDKILIDERKKAKDLCYEFNQLLPSDEENQKKIIEKLFGKVDKNFQITPTFWCDYGYNIEIGKNFYMNHNCVILDCAKVKFGDNVLVGPNCGFYTAGHPLDLMDRIKGIEFAKSITIGNNVWIGGGVKIMPGVSIGDNSVVAGGSIVVKDVPENVVVAGNPCKIIKKL